MEPERFRRAADLFLEALELDHGARLAFVRRADDEPGVKVEAEAMLAAHERAATFLETPAIRLAGRSGSLEGLPGSVASAHGPARGARVGDYLLVEEIARGGMGIVFRAVDQRLNRTVALKMIAGASLSSPPAVARFHAEARAVANLDHPNIVPIYEVGEQDGCPYYAMRLIEGGSLEQRLADFVLPGADTAGGSRRQAEAQRRIARLLASVARTVHAAHQQGVLHRDLKPANILIDDAGNPHVVDFGIAKLLAQDDNLTRTVAILGTPGYMAPEQAVSGSKRLTTAADVFSLGAILYQLLTGRRPFEGHTPLEALKKVVEHEPAAPRSLNPAIARDLETICVKCLDKAPDRRYASAAALADDLERWIAGEPITARAVGTVERTWRWCRRKPVVAALSVGLGGAVLTGLVVSTWQWQVARRTAQRLSENLYAADLGLAFQAWETERVVRARELLEQQRPGPGAADLRTFEWRYLYGLTRPHELSIVSGASKQLWGSAISPDGRLLATGGGDGQVQLWSLESRQMVAVFPTSTAIVYSLAFSPDGSLLATAEDTIPGEVQLWDVASHRRVARLTGLTKEVLAVAFSPDGRALVSGGGYPYATGDPGEVVLWDVATRTRVATLTGLTTSTGFPGFSPDGRLLAVPLGNGSVMVWDVEARRIAFTVTGHDGLVLCARFSPDGSRLATGGLDGTVRLWDVSSQALVSVLGSHQGAVYSLAFTPDGRRLASGGLDHALRIWDVGTLRPVASLLGHTSRVFSVSYSRDGRFIATASLDGTARIWSADVNATDAVFARHDGHFATVAFSRDGRYLLRAVPSGKDVTVWDAASGQRVFTEVEEGAGFAPDGRTLATIAAPVTLTLWNGDGNGFARRTTVALPSPVIGDPVFSPDGRHLAVGLADQPVVAILDPASGTPVAQVAGSPPPDGRSLFAFSPDNRYLATTLANGSICLWNTTSWSLLHTLDQPAQQVLSLAFSPDSRLLAAGGTDMDISLWSTDSWRQAGRLRGAAGAVYSLAFAPDGQTLTMGTADGVVRFWNVRSLREVATLRAHDSVVGGIAFAPDGRTLATSSVDETMKLWRAPGFDETDR